MVVFLAYIEYGLCWHLSIAKFQSEKQFFASLQEITKAIQLINAIPFFKILTYSKLSIIYLFVFLRRRDATFK